MRFGFPHPLRLSSRARRGTVLVVVLWISFSLVSLALYFADAMRVEYRAGENAAANRQAAQTVDGARRYVEFVLENYATSGQMPSTENYVSEQVPVGDALFWLVGRSTDPSVAGETLTYGLVSEAGKINVNMSFDNNVTPERLVEMLSALPGMTSDIAAAIVDWRDTDSEPLSGGAESGDYLLGDPPYMAKDARFETPEELRLVMGVDMAVLYGEDTNRNGVLDPNEDDGSVSPPDDDGDGTLDPGLLEYITVFSREPNTRTGGQGGTQNAFVEGRVNVNEAPVEVLTCIPGIGPEYASKIASARVGKTSSDFENVEWIREIVGEDAFTQAQPYITTRSYQFSADVTAVGSNGRGFARDLLVFDTTGDEPVAIYRRDLISRGWPLGAQVREDLESRQEP
ncbi:general secretion pathway protein GspK [Candidatus Sumerlaeota bacterium]|nr:general secretion pathway protein GspK [Candidatus Sumerlaeota bacterium]